MPNLKRMSHVMVDLETWGLTERSIILSAAFVYCDEEWNEIDFVRVNFDTKIQEEQYKRTKDKSTLEWWEQQNPAIYKLNLIEPKDPKDALYKLFTPFHEMKRKRDFLWWGNSAIFDLLKINSLSNDAFIMFDMMEYYSIDEYKMRCYKTTRDIFRDYYRIKEDYQLVTHDPLDDARAQVSFMRKVFLEGKKLQDMQLKSLRPPTSRIF